MATPNPAATQIRYGFEATEGLRDSASLIDMRVRSETMGGNFPLIAVDDIVAGAEEAEGLPTKIDPSGDLNVNWNAEDHAKLLANHFEKGAAPSTLASGAYLHKLATSETNTTFKSLQFEISRDTGQPQFYPGCQVQAVDFSLSPGGLLTGKASILAPRFDTWAPAVGITLDASPVLPHLRGLPNETNYLLTDGNVKFKVTTAPSMGTMGIKFTLGEAGTYGSSDEITVAIGAWYDAKLTATDVGDIGSKDMPVQIYFTDLTGYAADDEISFHREATVWSQSLAACSPFNEIAATVYVDSAAFRVRDLTLSSTRPVIRDPYIGGRFQDVMLEQGKFHRQLTIKRRNLDRSLQNKIMYAKKFGFRLDIYSGQLGATNYQRRISLIGLYAKPSGKTASVQNATTYEDDITATFLPGSDGTYPSSLTCEIVNSASVLQ